VSALLEGIRIGLALDWPSNLALGTLQIGFAFATNLGSGSRKDGRVVSHSSKDKLKYSAFKCNL